MNGKGHTIVFDLDGTLANVDHRRHWVRDAPKNWDLFYENCDKDLVNEWCKRLMNALEVQGYRIVIVTARRRSTKDKTLAWLYDNGIKFDEIFILRKDGDNTPDTELKRAWLNFYDPDKEKIWFVVDDRTKVVDMWRSEGLVCLQCDKWEEK